MPRRHSPKTKTSKRPYSVWIVRPKKRPIQLRYTCPIRNKEVRVSTGTRDEEEAEFQKRELEAKLILGIDLRKDSESEFGPEMDWDYFRDQYRTLHLDTLRRDTTMHAESRLDLAERILRPNTLGDIANANALQQLQIRLLNGEQSKREKPRSRYTVQGYMKSIMAAIN